jgi:DegV family protein with EDD domain
VNFGQDAYKEGVEMSHAAFYERLEKAPELPTTSQPSMGDFKKVFEGLAAAGHEMITLTISEKLSGTYSSAISAKEMLPEAKISVIDSRSTSVGLHLLVEAAAQAAAEGASRDEIVSLVDEIKGKLQVLFVVDTLEYLAKGGRIGNAKAFLGTLLKIKPILFLQDGAIEPLEQVRSRRKAIMHMLDLVEQHTDGHGSQARIGIAHGLALQDAQTVQKEIIDRLGCSRPFLSEIGPVIGTHTGPGVLGIAVYV